MCTTCHKELSDDFGHPIHSRLAKPQAILCQECHRNVSASMMLPSRHPVRGGKMGCSSCHQVHGSEVNSLKTDERLRELFLQCREAHFHIGREGISSPINRPTGFSLAEPNEPEEVASTAATAEASSPTEPQEEEAQSQAIFLGLALSRFTGGFVGGGMVYNKLTGSEIVVFKYTPAEQGVRGTGRLSSWGHLDGPAYELFGQILQGASDQTYSVENDLKRSWKSELDIIKLPQRLVNDPLTSLDAAKGGPVIWHNSNDSGILCCPVYRDLRWRNRVTVPSISLLSLHFDYRKQSWKGTYQARAMSRCSTSHVVSNVRDMDREMKEFRAGFEFGNTTAKIECEFLNRDLMGKAGTPTLFYNAVQRPAYETRAFTNRTQSEESDGPLPYNHIPRFKKNRHLVRSTVNLPKEGGLKQLLHDPYALEYHVTYGD